VCVGDANNRRRESHEPGLDDEHDVDRGVGGFDVGTAWPYLFAFRTSGDQLHSSDVVSLHDSGRTCCTSGTRDSVGQESGMERECPG
jgi:hypothetical protein